MKKGTKVVLNIILGGIIAFIGYLGFKKGMEAVEKEMEDIPPQPSQESEKEK